MLGRAERVGGPDRPPVHVGPIEPRHADRARDVLGEHATQCAADRDDVDADGLQRGERGLEAPLRLVAIEDVEELVLLHAIAPQGS